ncbi:hypothetical protein V2J09_008780 [Rumex salicifolius]
MRGKAYLGELEPATSFGGLMIINHKYNHQGLLLTKMIPRNMLRNNGTVEFEVGRQMPNQQHPEPYILLGSPPNFPQSSVHQILPPANLNNIDFHHISGNQDGTALYRMPQYPHQVHHPSGNLELGIPTPSNYYNPYLNPSSGGRMFPGPLNHSSMDQLPSSSNYGSSTAHVNGYGMNGFTPEGLSKNNGHEGLMGNTQYFNAPSATNVSVPPMHACHIDASGVAMMDACNPMPQFRGNYVGPSFQPPAVTWCERQPNGVGDSSNLAFNRPPIPPYFEAINVNGNPSEIGNAGPQSFHEGASTSRGSMNPLHYTPMLHALPEIHPQNIQGGSRRYNVNYRPLAVTNSSRHPPIENHIQYVGVSHPQQGPEAVQPPPPGIRIYRSHRRNGASENVHRHHNFPHLRLLPEDGVAVLEFSGHHEMSSAIDHHRDMRLDIDYMSYEELLALSEQIGDVKTGLSEASINAHLKTRIHRSSCSTINLEELPCSNDKKDSCVNTFYSFNDISESSYMIVALELYISLKTSHINLVLYEPICSLNMILDEYDDDDKLGRLDCGHEYHVDCIKKWLLLKNSCPICKSAALNSEQKNLLRAHEPENLIPKPVALQIKPDNARAASSDGPVPSPNLLLKLFLLPPTVTVEEPEIVDADDAALDYLRRATHALLRPVVNPLHNLLENPGLAHVPALWAGIWAY